MVTDPDELDILLTPHIHIPSINMKIQWIEKWINSDSDNSDISNSPSFGQRLVAFLIIEGVFFSSLFCSFYWLKHRGSTLPGMIQANEFIARDEGLHCEFAIALLRHVANKPSAEMIYEMMREAVAIEHQFVDDALPVSLIGMNASSMKEYVEYVADRVLKMISLDDANDVSHYLKPIFERPNPFYWLESISLDTLTSFFERRSTTYQDATASRSVVDSSFGHDADF